MTWPHHDLHLDHDLGCWEVSDELEKILEALDPLENQKTLVRRGKQLVELLRHAESRER